MPFEVVRFDDPTNPRIKRINIYKIDARGNREQFDSIAEANRAIIGAANDEDYERFLGDKSKELIERVEENIEVFKRLKDR